MRNTVRSNGYSLVEVLVVVLILGILSATIPAAIAKYASEKRVEMNIADFWMEINSLRAKALKGGSPAIVLFDTTNSTYTTHIDANGNDTAESSEIITVNEPLELSFGIPTPAPTSPAPGTADLKQISSSWRTGLRVRLNSTLTIPSGYLYLKNTARPNMGYCLTVTKGESEVQLFKWDGAKWFKF